MSPNHAVRPHATYVAEPVRRRWHAPRVIVAALLTGLLVATVAAPATAHDAAAQDSSDALTPNELDANGVKEIVFPVVGRVSFVDTWGACRGSRCHRSHKGVDIFAPRLAPLVAAADGVITANRQSALTTAGNTVIIKGDDGWRYLYLHLNNDSPGTDDNSNPQGWILPKRLRVGDRVKAGDVIGYLGDSGNAETTPAHLHFELHRPGHGAINPTPSVQAAKDQGRVVSTASVASTAEGRAEQAPTVTTWYRALWKRNPTEAELFAWTDRMAVGFGTEDDLIADLTMIKPRRDRTGTIVRSFEVVLDRRPNGNEILQWEQFYINGGGTTKISAELLASQAFQANGSLSDEAFIQLLYRQALDRGPSPERLSHWKTRLGDGAPRAELAAYLANSFAVKNSTWHDIEVTQAFRAALDRFPTDAEYERWVTHLDAGGLIPDVVATIRAERDTAAAAEPAEEEDEEGEENGTETKPVSDSD